MKALLLLDNAPSHPPLEKLRSGENIIAMYLPPNVTALIQPMDQNIIRLTKLHYRSSLLSTIVADRSLSVQEHLKALTVKDATVYLSEAWKKIQPSTIVKCWHKILPKNEDGEFDPEDDLPLSTYLDRVQDEEVNAVLQIKALHRELSPEVVSFKEFIT